MRDGFSDWSSVGSMPGLGSTRSYISQDYRVTTMKLRGRASTSKPQTRRAPRSMALKSASSFQNRNLDNYPMPHNREDAMRSAKGQRTQRMEVQCKMTKVKVDSGSMKEYSKEMFEFAIRTARNSNGVNGYNRSRHRSAKSESSKRLDNTDGYHGATNANNGPTNDGSILYNNKQQVLNSIRIRPHTEYVRRYDHERAKSSTKYNDTMNEKNQSYTVMTLNECGSRRVSIACGSTCSSKDLLLVPLDQSSEHSCSRAQSGKIRKTTVDMSFSEFNDTESLDTYQEPFDDFDAGNADSEVSFKAAHPAVHTLLPPSATCKLRLVSLDEESSSSEEEPEVPPPPLEVKPTKSQTNEEQGLDEKGKLVIPEPEPEVKPVKVKRKLKGPHCWVDDATVSSDQSELGAGDDALDETDAIQTTAESKQLANVNKSNTIVKKDTNLPIKQHPGQVVDTAAKYNQTDSKQNILQNPKEAFDKALETEQNKNIEANLQNDINGTEEHEDDAEYLPPFICPSSERKSREAAIKDWLSNTCYRSSNRRLPLV